MLLLVPPFLPRLYAMLWSLGSPRRRCAAKLDAGLVDQPGSMINDEAQVRERARFAGHTSKLQRAVAGCADAGSRLCACTVVRLQRPTRAAAG